MLRIQLLAAGLMTCMAISTPLAAQDSSDALEQAIIQCSEIANINDRVACYDSAASRARAAVAEAEVREEQQSEQQAIIAREEFGGETLPREVSPQAQRREEELQAITATVTRSRQTQPGYYAISLDDGTEWVFTESVGSRFFPPRNGAEVTVERGALGSYRMLIPRQAPVRVRRVR